MSYFFDSYAIIEILRGNPEYRKYLDFDLVTSTLNISEVYYSLIRELGEEQAKKNLRKLNPRLINVIKLHISLEASRFKFKYRKEKLSYIDCLGYILAKSLSMKFLTGDEKFENKNNVEFVK